MDSIINKSPNKIRSISCSTVRCNQRIYIHCCLSRFSLVVEREVYAEDIVGHSRRINQQTVESIQVRARTLRTVHRGLWPTWETWLYEVLHLSWTREGKGLVCLQSNKHIVRVHIHVSWLVKSFQCASSWTTSVGNVRWCRCRCGSGSGSRSWLRSRSIRPADWRLPTAAIPSLNLAWNTSRWATKTSITSLISNDESITTLRNTYTIIIRSISRSSAASAHSSWWASLTRSRTSYTSFSWIKVLASIAGNRLENKLLTNSKCIFIVSCRAVTTIDFSFVDSVQGADCASTLENELIGGTWELADSTTAQTKSTDTDTFSIRDDLVSSTSIAVTIAIQNLVSSALTYTQVSLENFAIRTFTASYSIIDHCSRTNWA